MAIPKSLYTDSSRFKEETNLKNDGEIIMDPWLEKQEESFKSHSKEEFEDSQDSSTQKEKKDSIS